MHMYTYKTRWNQAPDYLSKILAIFFFMGRFRVMSINHFQNETLLRNELCRQLSVSYAMRELCRFLGTLLADE